MPSVVLCNSIDCMFNDDGQCDVDKLAIADGVCAGSLRCGRNVSKNDLDERLKEENAKLRELVSVVYGYYASGTISPCDICDSIGCQYVGEAESGCRYHDRFDRAEAAEDEILKRMRKLGIEVE